MNSKPDKDKEEASMDESEFEASLVQDSESDLIEAKTRIIEPKLDAPEPVAKPARPAWAGKIMGHFRLIRLIGEGKMGRVILARDINLYRLVALKVLCKRMKGIGVQQRVDQFLREARAAAEIEHPNVVHIYEINQHDGWWYIAMEMLDGGNLRDVIKGAGPLSTPRACSFVADAADALAVAHHLGIIHRDIKPANLMLTRHGRCKVADFGLVRMDDPNDPFDFTKRAVGSPLFMAPEVILRKKQTTAIDIYSLGATLFYALTGKAPFTGQKIKDILKKHTEGDIPDIRNVLANCPQTLARLISRAMAKDPAQRPSATDMAACLRAEAIVPQAGDTAFAGSSTFARQAVGADSGTVNILTQTQQPPTSGLYARVRNIVRTHWIAVLSGLIVAIALLGLYTTRNRLMGPSKPDPARLVQYFPDAPKSYGLLPPGTIPELVVISPKDAPQFSWVGKVSTDGFRFIASKRGKSFYPIDASEAVLIRSEDFTGYKTSAEAVADGKTPAK